MDALAPLGAWAAVRGSLTTPSDAPAWLLFAIVTIPEDSRRMTANLQGPVIINRRTRVGRQFISPSPRWGIRHFILEEMELVRQGSCCSSPGSSMRA